MQLVKIRSLVYAVPNAIWVLSSYKHCDKEMGSVSRDTNGMSGIFTIPGTTDAIQVLFLRFREDELLLTHWFQTSILQNAEMACVCLTYSLNNEVQQLFTQSLH